MRKSISLLFILFIISISLFLTAYKPPSNLYETLLKESQLIIKAKVIKINDPVFINCSGYQLAKLKILHIYKGNYDSEYITVKFPIAKKVFGDRPIYSNKVSFKEGGFLKLFLVKKDRQYIPCHGTHGVGIFE